LIGGSDVMEGKKKVVLTLHTRDAIIQSLGVMKKVFPCTNYASVHPPVQFSFFKKSQMLRVVYQYRVFNSNGFVAAWIHSYGYCFDQKKN
jgi:hypothetical protein